MSGVYILIIALGVIVPGALFSVTFRNARKNLKIASLILGVPLEPCFMGYRIRGDYKGRAVNIFWHHGTRGPKTKIAMACRIPHRSKSWLVFDYPRPTENTLLVGPDVVYRYSAKVALIWEALTGKDFLDIFIELSRAAEIVEAGAPFYRGK